MYVVVGQLVIATLGILVLAFRGATRLFSPTEYSPSVHASLIAGSEKLTGGDPQNPERKDRRDATDLQPTVPNDKPEAP